MLDEIEHFFSFTTLLGKEFRALGRFGPDRAQQIVEKGIRSFLGDEATVPAYQDHPSTNDRW